MIVYILRVRLILFVPGGKGWKGWSSVCCYHTGEKMKRADKALARVFRTGNHCLREGVTNIFTLTKANGKYFKVRLKI